MCKESVLSHYFGAAARRQQQHRTHKRARASRRTRARTYTDTHAHAHAHTTHGKALVSYFTRRPHAHTHTCAPPCGARLVAAFRQDRAHYSGTPLVCPISALDPLSRYVRAKQNAAPVCCLCPLGARRRQANWGPLVRVTERACVWRGLCARKGGSPARRPHCLAAPLAPATSQPASQLDTIALLWIGSHDVSSLLLLLLSLPLQFVAPLLEHPSANIRDN